MTLATCKRMLANATNPEEKAFWENRIARKLRYVKYASEKPVEVKPEVKELIKVVKKNAKKR